MLFVLKVSNRSARRWILKTKTLIIAAKYNFCCVCTVRKSDIIYHKKKLQEEENTAGGKKCLGTDK